MTHIKILHIEDDLLDAGLVRGRLCASGFDCEIDVVQSETEFRQALARQCYQIILGDYRLPGFDGLSALQIARERHPEIPFLFVSGEMGEELAISSLKSGAVDYVLKDNLVRLGPAVENALAQAEARDARAKAEALLKKQEQEFRSLAENCPDMIARYDLNGRFVYINQRLADFIGIDISKMLGKPPRQIYPDGRLDSMQDKLSEVLTSLRGADLELEFHDGSTQHFLFTPEFDEKGALAGVLAFGRDITEIKQTQLILKGQTEAMASTNTALKVMLSHSQQAENALQEKILKNIENLILPYLDQLDKLGFKDDAAVCLSLIRKNINSLVSSFTKDLSASILGLTPREIQIADLVRKGVSSKEIANLLRLSKGTVEFYRNQIRLKLDVKNKKINLRSYLLSSFSE